DAGAKELGLADAEYHVAMATLGKLGESTPEIAFELRVADDQYAFMKQAVARLREGKERALQLEHIAKTSDHIVEALDRVAALFAHVGHVERDAPVAILDAPDAYEVTPALPVLVGEPTARIAELSRMGALVALDDP